MILLTLAAIWRELAELARAADSAFGDLRSTTYVEGVAGICVTLFSCSKVTSRNTLPLLRGLAVIQPGPFFYPNAAYIRPPLGVADAGFEYFHNKETCPRALGRTRHSERYPMNENRQPRGLAD